MEGELLDELEVGRAEDKNVDLRAGSVSLEGEMKQRTSRRSEKSMSMWLVLSILHALYKHAATTYWVRRP